MRVQEQAYLKLSHAEKRVKHLMEQDGKYAEVWPVFFDVGQLTPTYATPPLNYWPASAVYTADRGAELHDYGRDMRTRIKLPTPPGSLGDVISASWDSWRAARAAQGAFEDAAQEPPAIPAELFEERSGRPVLFPRALP